jgi:cyanophycinase-like exopeptidase
MQEPTAVVHIDPRYVEVCEANSIEVCGTSANIPVMIGAVVEGGQVNLSMASLSPIASPVRVVVRLTGIRKGFADKRFPNRTQKQFEANERFINSAYPAE